MCDRSLMIIEKLGDDLKLYSLYNNRTGSPLSGIELVDPMELNDLFELKEWEQLVTINMETYSVNQFTSNQPKN